jgi:tryptophanyl-tRNA synthetase
MTDHDDDTDTTTDHGHGTEQRVGADSHEDHTVTPYDVAGDVDYDRVREQFGAAALTDADVDSFPEPVHQLLRRRVFYAGRDVRRFTEAAAAGDRVSVVTGVGPSGPMHLGHVLVFYFARYLQREAGAHVYIPLSDDEKLFGGDLSPRERRQYTRSNLRNLLGVGFDPERTRILVDTVDAEAVYPHAARFAGELTTDAVESAYGRQDRPGRLFYPAVQTTHLLLPQLVDGPHPTLVPVAVDQDPHVRVSRDVAGKDRYDVTKPAALLSKFLPRLDGGGGKMSSSDHDSPESATASDTDTASPTASDDSAGSVAASDDGTAPPIYLDDDRETVERKFQRHAYSGGKSSVEAHRREGGNPAVDVAYRFLHAFFEPDDEEIERIAEQYRDGSLLSGELKQRAADAVATFLERHRERRPDDDVPVAEAVDPYRLRADERARLRNDL